MATLIFTGNSFGEYKPCPTCGGHALGGLGRRAGFFARTRADHPGALFLSGGYEFVSYIKRRKVEPTVFDPIARAYGMLSYDLGLVQPEEMAALSEEGVAPPEAFVSTQERPQVRVLECGGTKIGVVVFPLKRDAYAGVGDAPKALVDEAARSLRGKVDLVVGLSGWGERDERKFVAEFPGALDVLLGAGPGTGYGTRTLGDGRTVWVRVPFDGRGVMQLDVLSLPGGDGVWSEGRQYISTVVELDASIHEDVQVTNLFSWL